METDSGGRTSTGTESSPIPPRWDATPLWQHALAAAVIGPVLSWARGPGAAARFTAAVAVSAGVQAAFVDHLRGRLGAAVPSPADAVTLVRATSGATLLALVACGGRDGAGPSRGIAFALLLGAVASDWVDGPLARRDGPSRLGAMLDIEADSLLTLGGAAAATAWGGLPRIALLPAALRYRDPVLALCRGEDPSGGGPWWCRASGAAQMALFLAALRPGLSRAERWRRPAAHAVFITQLTTQVLDGRRRNPRSPSSRVAGCRSPASVRSLAFDKSPGPLCIFSRRRFPHMHANRSCGALTRSRLSIASVRSSALRAVRLRRADQCLPFADPEDRKRPRVVTCLWL